MKITNNAVKRTAVEVEDLTSGTRIWFTFLHSTDFPITNCEELFYYLNEAGLYGPETGNVANWNICYGTVWDAESAEYKMDPETTHLDVMFYTGKIKRFTANPEEFKWTFSNNLTF